MIDPKKITDFNRSDSELQEFWLFCIAVAGKTASQIAVKIDGFLSPRKADETPYEFIRRLVSTNSLRAEMERVKLGKYDLLSKAYSFCVSDAGPDLRKASVQDLEQVHGVRHKTSRFFLLHSRAGADVAVIDTHVLKYLKHRGHPGIPDGVPQNNSYYDLEALMKAEAEAHAMPLAEFDLAVWNHYSSGGLEPLPVAA